MTDRNPYAPPQTEPEDALDQELESRQDRIGWTLVALPVIAAVPTYVLSIDAVQWVTVGMVIATFVLASVDAQRLRASWIPTLAILALWIVGYPYWLHRRARHGTLRLVPLGLAAMIVWGMVVAVRLL